jgi:hypothetical protein
LALQNADVAQTKALNADYATTFAEQQGILGPLQAKLSYMATNPMGYSAPALAAQKASINNNTATAAKQAIGAAAAYSAAHGGADVGGGGIASTVGKIANEAAQSKAGQLENLTMSNEQLKQQNMWNALSGLQSVGAQYGGQGSTAAGTTAGVSNAGQGAGAGAVSAANTGWSDFGSVLSGIAGLGMAGASAYKTFSTPAPQAP